MKKSKEVPAGVTIRPPDLPQIGRPSKFTPEIREATLRLAALGIGERTIAGFVGVDRSTLTRWKQRDEDFARELGQARCACVAGVHSKLLEAVRRGNVRAIELFLRLRTPEQFRDARNVMEGKPAPEEVPMPEMMVVRGEGPPEKVALEQLIKQGWTVLPPEG